MTDNIYAFTAPKRETPVRRKAETRRDNVIALTQWLGRAIPRRTPNGVFFMTRVLETTGEIA